MLTKFGITSSNHFTVDTVQTISLQLLIFKFIENVLPLKKTVVMLLLFQKENTIFSCSNRL